MNSWVKVGYAGGKPNRPLHLDLDTRIDVTDREGMLMLDLLVSEVNWDFVYSWRPRINEPRGVFACADPDFKPVSYQFAEVPKVKYVDLNGNWGREYVELIEILRTIINSPSSDNCAKGLVVIEAYDAEVLYVTPDGVEVTRKTDREFKQWLADRKEVVSCPKTS